MGSTVIRAMLATLTATLTVQAAAQTRTERWSDNFELPQQAPVTRNPADVAAPAAPATGSSSAIRANSSSAVSGTSLCRKGDAVSVLYAGQWYPARVLDGPDRLGTCLVSYDGFGSNWDEWVNAQRMRPSTSNQSTTAPAATEAARTAKAPAAASPRSIPTGKYSCYTFDAGQLNYAYTDVIIESGLRYSIGRGKGGSYALFQDGRVTFTGAMSNATGRYSVKTNGKAQLDLVFNGDARASMSCPKS